MATVNFNAGSAIVTSGEQATVGGPIIPIMSIGDPTSRATIDVRLQILVAMWAAEGGDGDCPDETDTDLVAGNALQ